MSMATAEQRNRAAENAEDAAGFQETAGIALLIPLGLIISTVLGNPEIGIPVVVAGLATVVRGIENHHKAKTLQSSKELPAIRTKRFGRILYP